MTLSGLLCACLFLQLSGAAFHKLRDQTRAREATARLLGPASALAAPGLCAAIAIEAGSAVALLVPGGTAIGAAGAAVLWLVYACAAGAAWLAGERRFDCGCTLGTRERASDVRLVVARAVILAVLALALLAVGSQPVWRDPFALASATGFTTLAFATSQLLLNRRYQGKLAT